MCHLWGWGMVGDKEIKSIFHRLQLVDLLVKENKANPARLNSADP